MSRKKVLNKDSSPYDIYEGSSFPICFSLHHVPEQLSEAERMRLLGAKGAGIVTLHEIGLRVPPALIIPTTIYPLFQKDPEKTLHDIMTVLKEKISYLEEACGKKFGSSSGSPLLVSVRSGAATSMPGMMDTILNVGIQEERLEDMRRMAEAQGGSSSFAYEIYGRFLYHYGTLVLGLSEEKLPRYSTSAQQDLYLWQSYIQDIKHHISLHTGKAFSQDVWEHLMASIAAVFSSWNNPRARVYREFHNISPDEGTAIIIQAMVFGNFNDRSGTIVAFTRNPISGESHLFGEYLSKAQGEDLVSGAATPFSLTEGKKSFVTLFPELYNTLKNIAEKIEKHYGDMQELECTFEDSVLWILQTRWGKRTPQAAAKIAWDFIVTGKALSHHILSLLDPLLFEKMLHGQLEGEEDLQLFTTGLPASPGVAVGRVVFDSMGSIAAKSKGIPTIFVRNETSPEHIQDMAVSEGMLTAHGGVTSHAAVVARGMGIPCIVGADHLQVLGNEGIMKVRDQIVEEGDWVSLDATSGKVYLGKAQKISQGLSLEGAFLLKTACQAKRMAIYANAESPEEIERALNFGGEGVGLCRTEHMFFATDALLAFRQMILAESLSYRTKALDYLLPLQQKDFFDILRLLHGRPLIVRLLDPPLHEFLPKTEIDLIEFANTVKMSYKDLDAHMDSIKESNPMLGHRGCRLAVTFPEIYTMQVQALFAAVGRCHKENIPVDLGILIPFVSSEEELLWVKKQIISQEVHFPFPLSYKIGAMLETPRALLLTKHMARHVDFLSFGTNDLTQMTFALSRDDSQKFLSQYVEKKLWRGDPFQSIDVEGVGMLMKMACEQARHVNPSVKLGVCGEHAGDPQSVRFFESLQMDYLSCSAFRLPTVHLAAAQAFLGATANDTVLTT